MNATPSVLSRSADEALHGTEIPRGGADGVSPEQSLFRAVIATAFNDLVASDIVLAGKNRKGTDRAFTAERERKRAIRFLTATFGDWCEQRQIICDLANVNADLVRKIAVRRVAQIKQQQEKQPAAVDHDALAKRARVDLDAMLAQLLSRSDLDESDISDALGDLAEDETECSLATTA